MKVQVVQMQYHINFSCLLICHVLFITGQKIRYRFTTYTQIHYINNVFRYQIEYLFYIMEEFDQYYYRM